MRSILFSLVCSSAMALAAAGCGGASRSAEPATAADQNAQQPPPPPKVQEPPLPAGHVWRSQVMEVLSPGPGQFLQKLEVKPELRGGRFFGFRVVALRDATFWRGVDLQVGDIVRSVNGKSIGHYDEAFHVWQSLATAPELVVVLDRGGEPHTIRYVIHDPGQPAPTDDQHSSTTATSHANPQQPTAKGTGAEKPRAQGTPPPSAAVSPQPAKSPDSSPNKTGGVPAK